MAFVIIICPISIAQHGTDYKTTCVLLSVCLSIRLSVRVPIRSQFLFDFDEILRRCWSPKSKNAFVGGQNPMIPSLFCPIFTPVMHFQWEGPSTEVTSPVDRLWGLRAQTTCLGSGYKYKVAKWCNPQFCPQSRKTGISASSVGIYVRSRRWIQIEHLRETIYCQSNGHVTDDVTSRDLKGQCRDPSKSLKHYNCANQTVGSN